MAGKVNNFAIGLIGMGDMGKMYANRLSEAGWRYVPFLALSRYYHGKPSPFLPRRPLLP
jgi:hypothetical protein